MHPIPPLMSAGAGVAVGVQAPLPPESSRDWLWAASLRRRTLTDMALPIVMGRTAMLQVFTAITATLQAGVSRMHSETATDPPGTRRRGRCCPTILGGELRSPHNV